MNVAAGPKLAAAVSNAGGLGVIGGVGYTPDMLREQIAELKEALDDKNAPFGVDLLLPQVGGSARKTKYVDTQHERKHGKSHASGHHGILQGESSGLTVAIATTTPRASSTNSSTSSSTPAPSSSSQPSASPPKPSSTSCTSTASST